MQFLEINLGSHSQEFSEMPSTMYMYLFALVLCVCTGIYISRWGPKLECTPTYGDSCHCEDQMGKKAYKPYRTMFFLNTKSFL